MPAVMLPSIIAEQWLYSVLSTDTTLISLLTGSKGLRIFEGHPPQSLYVPVSLTYPCIVYSLRSGVDRYVIGDRRIMSEQAYLVKVIGQTASFMDVAPVARRMDTVLHGNSGVVNEGRVIECKRDLNINLNETADGGVEFRHLGGIYTLLVQGN